MKKIILSLAFVGMIFGANAQKNVSSSVKIDGKVTITNTVKSTCDTLSVLTGPEDSLTIYGAQGGGFVTGTNSYGDLAKAQYFTYSGTGTQITGAFVYLVIKDDNGDGMSIDFKAWNPLNDSTPGAEISAGTLTLGAMPTLPKDTFVWVDMTPSGNVSGNFILGMIIPTTTNDTVGIVSNYNGGAQAPEVGLEQWSNGTWYTIPGAWQGLSIALAIFPVVCDQQTGDDAATLNNVVVYPTLTTGKVLFGGLKAATVSVYDVTGNKVTSFSNVSSRINLSNLNNGVYILRIEENGKVLNRKVVLQK